MAVSLLKYHRVSDAEYRAAYDRVSTGQREEVDELLHKAMGYVWGYEDAKGDRIRELVASWEFAHAYAWLAAKWRLGEVKTCPPIQDAWLCWSAGHRLDQHELYCNGAK